MSWSTYFSPDRIRVDGIQRRNHCDTLKDEIYRSIGRVCMRVDCFRDVVERQVKEAAVVSSPADNIIALLTQVKKNLEHIDASSSARATERQRHCVKRKDHGE